MDLIGHVPQIEMRAELLRKDGSIKKSASLGGGFSECKITATVEDVEGNEKYKQEFPFKSFVHNWNRVYQYAFNALSNASAGLTINKLIASDGGVTTATAAHSVRIDAPSGSTGWGVQLGANDASAGYDGNINNDEVHVDDYKLRRQIKTNASLSHGVTGIKLGSNEDELIITRSFVNETGSPLVIREVGIMGQDENDSTAILLSRDIKDKNGRRLSITLGANETIRIKFRFKVTTSTEGGFVANYLKMIKSDLQGASEAVVKSTGTESTLGFHESYAAGKQILSAGAAETAYGILVGNGNYSGIVGLSADGSNNKRQPVQVGYTDYKLNNAITTLTHSAHTAINLTTEYPKFNKVASMFGVRRDFTNDGSDDVLVNEIGLFVRNTDQATNNVMVARYALPENLLVGEGEILRVRFYFKHDVFSKAALTASDSEV